MLFHFTYGNNGWAFNQYNIVLVSIRKKKRSFHSIWPAPLKAFALSFLFKRCCFSNAFTWCVKIRIVNRSNGKYIFLCPYSQNMLIILSYGPTWFIFAFLLVKDELHASSVMWILKIDLIRNFESAKLSELELRM
jgi:hypothetical protein